MSKIRNYSSITSTALKERWVLWLTISVGFIVLYYTGLLVATMIRFGEIPNYIEVYDIGHVYQQIFAGTPALSDAIFILIDEAWIEMGYKNPDYYGIATWSYMLIPPKMLLLLLMGMLLATLVVLSAYGNHLACPLKNKTRMYTVAGVGSGLVGLAGATLTWVVCCATPSWVVALAMLGMSASLALWLEPFGNFLNILGIGLVVWIIYAQLKYLEYHLVGIKTA